MARFHNISLTRKKRGRERERDKQMYKEKGLRKELLKIK